MIRKTNSGPSYISSPLVFFTIILFWTITSVVSINTVPTPPNTEKLRGYALYFDSNNVLTSTSGTTSLTTSTGPITVSLQLYSNTTGQFFLSASGFTLNCTSSGSTLFGATTSWTPTPNVWAFYSFVYNTPLGGSPSLDIYVNAELATTLNPPQLSSYSPSGWSFVASYVYLAEIQVWNEARDVAELYVDMIPHSYQGTEDGLSAYYDFPEGQGSTSQGGHDGLPIELIGVTWEDVDECSANLPSPCDQGFACINTVGSFFCRNPTVTSNEAISTSGGATLIYGTDFGPAGTQYLSSVHINGVACTSPTVVDEQTISCNAPQGAGVTGNTITINIFGETVTGSAFEYATPSISSFNASSPTTGGVAVAMTGDNFGPIGTSITFTFDGNDVAATVTIAHTQITFIVPAGVATVMVEVDVNGLTSEAFSFTYENPVIDSISNSTLSTRGGAITIFGRNFGFSGWSDPEALRMVSIGPNECGQVVVVSDNTITCNVPPFYNTHLSLDVHIGVLIENTPNILSLSTPSTFNYVAPVATHISTHSAHSTEGGFTVTVFGTNFGPFNTPINVSVGPYEATGVVVVEHEQVTFEIPAGTGINNEITLVVGSNGAACDGTAQSTTLPASQNITYLAPFVTAVVPHDNIPTLGGVVTIFGFNFGPASLPSGIQRKILFSTKECTGAVLDQRIATCSLAAGTGEDDFTVHVNVDLQDTTPTHHAIIERAHPQIFKVTPNQFVPLGATITIFGQYFGGLTPSAKKQVFIGNSLCSNIKLIDDTQLTCVSASTGANQYVKVIIDGLESSDDVVIDFQNALSPGLSCQPPNGAQDRYHRHMCNCWSGFAPTTSLFTDCELSAVCPGQEIEAANEAGNSAPARPSTSFENDHLTIVQTMAISELRRDVNIKFLNPFNSAQGSATCTYPGSIWTKTLGDLDCQDIFTAVMPWTMNEMCGFHRDFFAKENGTLPSPADLVERATYIFYKSLMVTTYSEMHTTDLGENVLRTSSASYLLSVKFAKEITALVNSAFSVYVQSPPEPVTVMVVGDSLYDPSTGIVLVTFQTKVNWPYMLNASGTIPQTWKSSSSQPSPIPEGDSLQFAANLAVRQPAGVVCSSSESSDCLQQWIATIIVDTGTYCVTDIEGLFTFKNSLLCRDLSSGSGACPGADSSLSVEFFLRSGPTSLCDDPSYTNQASAGTTIDLSAFTDPEHLDSQTSYVTGQRVYFTLEVVSPLATLEQVTFNTIKFTTGSSSQTDVLYTISPSATTKSDINFVMSEQFDDVDPGDTALLLFQLDLFRDQFNSLSGLNITLGDDNDFQILKVEVTVDLLYHGNAKHTRSVTATLNEQKAQPFSSKAKDEISLTIRSNQKTTSKAIVEEKKGFLEQGLFGSDSSRSSHNIHILFVVCLVVGVLFF